MKSQDEQECQEQKNKINWVRVYLLDELVYHNGKKLNPYLIGDITQSVMDKLRDKM